MHAPICERTKRSVAAAESNFNLEHQVCDGVPSSPTAYGHWLRDMATYLGPFHILQVVHLFAPHHVATRVANSDGGVCYQRRRRGALPTGYFFPSGPCLSPAIKISSSGSRGTRPSHPWSTANRRNRGLQRCVWPLGGPTGDRKRLGRRVNSDYLSPTAGTPAADTPSADWGRHARCSRLGRHSRCTLQGHPMHTTALEQISFASARWETAAAQERAQILHRNAGSHPQKPDPTGGVWVV